MLSNKYPDNMFYLRSNIIFTLSIKIDTKIFIVFVESIFELIPQIIEQINP